MGTTIRKKVFETNSSSSHSITIEVGGKWDNIPLNQYRNITLNGGEFGWEQKRYRDALTKANYCAVDQLNNEDHLDMLKRVIKDYTNCNDVIINISRDWDDDYRSYIDHQSIGTSDNAFIDKETLKNFIFNKNSYLETDNDNH